MTPDKPTQSPLQAGVPLVYANSFNILVSNADVGVGLYVSGQPVMNVMFSYNAMKSLAIALNTAVEKIESTTKQKILTTEELQGAVATMINPAKN